MFGSCSERGIVKITWLVVFVVFAAIGYWAQRELYWSEYPESKRRAWTRAGTKPAFFNDWNCSDRVRWAQDRFQEYGLSEQMVLQVARDYGVPPRILATAIINELSDYDMRDHLQEYMYAKFHSREYSYGIAQLQPDRVIGHELSRFSERDIREHWGAWGGHPPQYVAPGELDIATISGEISPSYRHRGRVEIYLAWRQLLHPPHALALAAAELRYILQRFSTMTRSSRMVQAFLAGPIDLRDPLRNVRPQPHPYFADRSIKAQKEATLTYAALIEYNSPGKFAGLHDADRGFFRFDARESNGEGAELFALEGLNLWLSCFQAANYPESSGSSSEGFFGIDASGTRYAYIVDRSGSMKDAGRMARAQAELRKSVQGLERGTPFRVVFFSDGPSLPPARVSESVWTRAGTPEAQRILGWADQVKPSGGTSPLSAFGVVMRDADKPDIVFLLSDGNFDKREPERIRAINSPNGTTIARIYTVALGDRASSSQLQAIASQSGGHSVEVER